MGLISNKYFANRTELDLLVKQQKMLNKPYEIIGFVSATVLKVTETNPIKVANAVAKEAKKMGADAVIGFRYEMRLNAINWTEQAGYGTAIKFI